jgi:hypothetical protein
MSTKAKNKFLKLGKSEESDDKKDSERTDKKEDSTEFDPLITSGERSAAATTATATITTITAISPGEGGAGDEYADSLLEIARLYF